MDPRDATALFFLSEALADSPDGKKAVLARFNKYGGFLANTVSAIEKEALDLNLVNLDQSGLRQIAESLAQSEQHRIVGRALLISLDRHSSRTRGGRGRSARRTLHLKP